MGDRAGGVAAWDVDLFEATAPRLELSRGGVRGRGERKGKRGGRRGGKGLGGSSSSSSSSPACCSSSHTDAVLCLKWNWEAPQHLASASADHSVKLWDLDHGTCTQTRDGSHKDKVQSLDWSRTESCLLLSAGFDPVAVLHDCRAQDRSMARALHEIPEQIAWHGASEFAVSHTDGSLKVFDLRKMGRDDPALLTLQAHPTGTVFSFSPQIPGLLATGGGDKKVSLWDLREGGGGGESGPSLVASHALGVGEVFAIAFHPQDPTLLTAGGSQDKVLIYTVEEEVKRHGFVVPAR